MLSHHYHDWGFTKSLKSAGQPSDLAEQLASRHLCAALAEPLLRHTEILWRQYAPKEDAAQVVPAIGIPRATSLQRRMKACSSFPSAPSFSMARGIKPRPSWSQAGPYFWRFRRSATFAACPAWLAAVSASAFFFFFTQARPQSQCGELWGCLVVGLDTLGRPEVSASSCV